MLHNPFRKELFPSSQPTPPLAQLEAVAFCPIACCLGEETDPLPATLRWLERAMGSPLSLPFLWAPHQPVPRKTCARGTVEFSNELYSF